MHEQARLKEKPHTSVRIQVSHGGWPGGYHSQFDDVSCVALYSAVKHRKLRTLPCGDGGRNHASAPPVESSQRLQQDELLDNLLTELFFFQTLRLLQ